MMACPNLTFTKFSFYFLGLDSRKTSNSKRRPNTYLKKKTKRKEKCNVLAQETKWALELQSFLSFGSAPFRESGFVGLHFSFKYLGYKNPKRSLNY